MFKIVRNKEIYQIAPTLHELNLSLDRFFAMEISRNDLFKQYPVICLETFLSKVKSVVDDLFKKGCIEHFD